MACICRSDKYPLKDNSFSYVSKSVRQHLLAHLFSREKIHLQSSKLQHTVHVKNSAQPISVRLNCHNLTHSSMSELWGPVLLSKAPLCRCHLRDNRNARLLQPSLPPQSEADCWSVDCSVGGRRESQ